MKHRQQGLSSWSLLLVIIVAAFFLLCAAKLAPIYAENYYITSGLKSLAKKPDALANMTTAEIRDDLYNFYTINNVRSDGAKELDINRISGGVIIDNRYEVRVDLLANIDVVVQFHNRLNSTQPDQCCSAPDEPQ